MRGAMLAGGGFFTRMAVAFWQTGIEIPVSLVEQ